MTESDSRVFVSLQPLCEDESCSAGGAEAAGGQDPPGGGAAEGAEGESGSGTGDGDGDVTGIRTLLRQENRKTGNGEEMKENRKS